MSPVTAAGQGGAGLPGIHGAGMPAPAGIGAPEATPIGSGGAGTPAMSAGSGGATPHSDAGAAGSATPMADSGSANPEPAADAGSGSSGCTRGSLRATIDAYFAALAAHDPGPLPTASSVRFTENAMEAQLGSGLLWKTAGAVKFTRSLLDSERCGTVTEAVVPNSGTDTIVGVRLKLEAQQLTEIETIVVDPDNGFFPTPMGIINSKADAWEDLVPEAQRAPREELEAAGKAYFASFGDSSLKVPYAMPCDRLENGFKTTQGDCSNFGGAVGLNQPEQRYPVTDLEAGISAGFILFAGADIDFHMFKVIDHEIRWINAVVGPAVRSQGWE